MYVIKKKIIEIIKLILWIISRIIFYLIPKEYRPLPPLRRLLDDRRTKKIYETFKEDLKSSLLFYDEWESRKYAIELALLNDKNKDFYYLEFGVWKGGTANFFSKYVKKLYAFDSFEGLRDEYAGTSAPRGFFNLNKKLPKLNPNIEPIVGYIQDTLDDFLKKHNPKINFLHLDMDTYASTKYALDKLKPYLVKNAVIIFDELYNYIGWEYGEYKALKEVFKDEEYEYKSFAVHDKEVVIQLNLK